jgi:hypothetical protein
MIRESLKVYSLCSLRFFLKKNTVALAYFSLFDFCSLPLLEVISRFSTYGTGYLKEQEFLQLYKDVLTVDIENGTLKRPSKRRISSVQKIWRDFAAHGIHCPNEVEWNRKKSEIETFSHAHDNNKNKSGSKIQLLHDECEVLEVNKDNISPHWTVDSKGAKNLRRSSHQLVELCSDNETPKRIRDGQFG